MSKRNKDKLPNLKKQFNTGARQDVLDIDYLDQLNDEAKEWLNQFFGEFYSTNGLNPIDEIKDYNTIRQKYKKTLRQLNKKPKKNKKEINYYETKLKEVEDALKFLRDEQGVMHSSCEQVDELYGNNNARNRCMYTNLKSRGMLLELTTDTCDNFLSKAIDRLGITDFEPDELSEDDD